MTLGKLAMFGFGYVLGSKAGRERYGQIIAAAKRASIYLDEYGRRLDALSDGADNPRR
jgi:hypothetical protein